MERTFRKVVKVLDAKAANGVGTTVPVSEYKDIFIQLSASDLATLVVKFQGSFSDTAPDFSATQSATNHWDYIATYDLQDPSSIVSGDTGISLDNASVAESVRNLFFNTNGLQYICMEVSSYTDGNVTASICGYSY